MVFVYYADDGPGREVPILRLATVGCPERRRCSIARPRIPLLSPDLIADAALALVDSGQPFGVNALARSLGVTPSSLYNHVDGRDAIIELMRGRLGTTYLAEMPSGTWDEVVAATMRASRRMYSEHP